MPFDSLLAIVDALPDVTSLGVTGLIGAMWLWERRSSLTREQMLDDAHARILADKVQLDALVELVQRNTEALTRLTARLDAGTNFNGREK
jgi:hypothetical protein